MGRVGGFLFEENILVIKQHGMASNATAGHNCPSPMKATSNGLFQGDSPIDYALPLAILQICLVVALTRGLAVLLRPLRQPRVVAEIIDRKVLNDQTFAIMIRRIQKDDSVRYEEKAVRNVTETIAAIRGAGHCNLFLVGRMPEGELALALRRRSECPELGPVGSLLISPDFSTTASVLVIQQYNGYISPNLASEMEEE
ncbi:hypothetical protein V6N13_026574 [Hibiscus sabdariffa]